MALRYRQQVVLPERNYEAPRSLPCEIGRKRRTRSSDRMVRFDQEAGVRFGSGAGPMTLVQISALAQERIRSGSCPRASPRKSGQATVKGSAALSAIRQSIPQSDCTNSRFRHSAGIVTTAYTSPVTKRGSNAKASHDRLVRALPSAVRRVGVTELVLL